MTRYAGLVRGAVLSDPPLLALVPEATAALAAERERIRAAVRERGNEAGVEAWLDDRAGARALERARAAHRAFYADYAGLASWPVTRRGLRALAHPVVVVTGPASPATLVSAADRLAELLPAARRATDGDVQAAARGLLP
jgi:pimeloyl-ACP methyl ester carboxylesterase